MVERLTDYTRRIWTCLGADEPDPDMQVGDVIYYMDTSTCSIITGIPAPGSIDTVDLPDIGGGGGGEHYEERITIRNETGTGYAYLFVPSWNTVYGGWYASYLTNQPTGTTFFNNSPGKVQYDSDGRRFFLMWAQTGTNRVPGPITYNGEPLTDAIVQGSARSYNYKVYLPEDYDSTIPIIFT